MVQKSGIIKRFLGATYSNQILHLNSVSEPEKIEDSKNLSMHKIEPHNPPTQINRIRSRHCDSVYILWANGFAHAHKHTSLAWPDNQCANRCSLAPDALPGRDGYSPFARSAWTLQRMASLHKHNSGKTLGGHIYTSNSKA